MAEGETYCVVYQQLRDVIIEQQRKIRVFEELVKQQEEKTAYREEFEAVVKELEVRTLKLIEDEKLEHAKTKALLSKESEKLQFALGEIEILMKQLDREKKAFENALESIKNKALKESTKNDMLKSKCNEIENQMEKQDGILNIKEDQIKNLNQLLEKQKDTLRQKVTDFEIQKQQDAYIAQVLKDKKRKTFGKFHHAPK
ncbi:spermatogenesis-associated protein 24-like isoform X1 [Hemiscyllium ocellatum]|uniref:spermatogenesis-associated protein 24-like isoform X1 n=1 Tax=Hemiscyllium ocellatum TaxID=170820 RepID=UPI002966C825|nr:spermatogenesis-associated protein 24-like isoform X1 [Hemiscyllium ocellatum]